MKEAWKDIKGYEGLYQVSDHGRVKALERICPAKNNSLMTRKEKQLKLTKNPNNYYSVTLIKDRKRKHFTVHILVALNFLGERPVVNGKPYEIDHKDEDTYNNHISNLRYITKRLNVARSRKNKTSKYQGVCYVTRLGKWLAQIQIDGKNISLGNFNLEEDAAQAYRYALAEYEKE